MSNDAIGERHRKRMRRYLFLAAWFFAMHACAAISVRDDAGNTIVLQKPAQRIVTLAPHITELVFAAGGGEHIVGTASYSDYPPAARGIPLIGDDRQIDMERLIAIKPDLLVLWLHGSSTRQLEQLRKSGVALFYSEPHTLNEIPETLLRLGQLMGTEAQARQAATEFQKKLNGLAARYSGRPPVRVFYQVWDRPLYTLNGRQIVSDVLRVCGAENIFASLAATAPVVGVESVLQENPDVIIAGFEGSNAKRGLENWKKYPALTAVRSGNLFAVNADLLSRPGPRMIFGATELCEKIEDARNHLKTRP